MDRTRRDERRKVDKLLYGWHVFSQNTLRLSGMIMRVTNIVT